MNIPISWFRLTKPREIYEGSLSEELHRLKIRFNCKLSRTMAGNCTWGGSNDYVRSIIKLWKSIVITKIDFRASSVGWEFEQGQICNPGKRVVCSVSLNLLPYCFAFHFSSLSKTIKILFLPFGNFFFNFIFSYMLKDGS